MTDTQAIHLKLVRMEERQIRDSSQLDRIEKQTTETNGRVRKLEDSTIRHDEQIRSLFAKRGQRSSEDESRDERVKASKESGDDRQWTKRDTWRIGIGGGGVIGLWKLIAYAISVLKP